MNTIATRSSHSRGKWLALAHYSWYVCAVVVGIILLGALPVYISHLAQPVQLDPYGLGQFNLPFQLILGLGDVASAFVSFALAVLLFWRKPDDRMALFASFFFLFTSIAWSSSLDHFLNLYVGTPSMGRLLASLSTPPTILLFSIFPDGRFVPRWTRGLVLFSIPAALFQGFAREPLNSIPSGALLFAVIGAVVYSLYMLVMYAQAYRYRHVSSYAERQQTKWWVFGLVLTLGLSLIASLIYKQLSPPLINITPIAFTIAILRSRLWDIDIVIRRTVTYSLLTAILGAVYFGGVVVLQQLFRALTGTGGDLAIILSTLAIAALFNPLRHRIQDAIDRRFYRRKYDAQKVLAQFAVTARDETDLDKLTQGLINVVDDTMRPENVSVWLQAAQPLERRQGK